MSYQKEWLLLEANDEVDEMEHRDPSEEYQFYRAVADGDVNAVRHNCELGRFREGEGVGQLSRDPVLNLKYHFVITTAMVTRLCGQHGMELEQAFRLSDFYIQKLDDLHTADEVCALHDEMVMDFTKKMRKNLRSDTTGTTEKRIRNSPRCTAGAVSLERVPGKRDHSTSRMSFSACSLSAGR